MLRTHLLPFLAWSAVASFSAAQTLPNGVAAGDTTQTSTVLWTRSTALGTVRFDYSTDPTFAALAGSIDVAVVDTTIPVKAALAGLTPGTSYFYRVEDSVGSLADGTFRTSAPSGVRTGLRFGVSGDWRGELGPYPSIANADKRNLEFFVALGDTIYADFPSPALAANATTLPEFRLKHAEVYSERFGLNALADLRATTSTIAVIDDHEVRDDFAGGAPPASHPDFVGPEAMINETPLYQNGLTAFQEYNPIADVHYGATGDPRTTGKLKQYRFNTYGSDAALITLDARSFRDLELPNATTPALIEPFVAASFNPSRTMLGRAQLDELKADLTTAQAAGILWKFVAVPEPIQYLGPAFAADRFEGYAAERTELLKFIDDAHIDNVVFIAADIHGTVVNDLSYRESAAGVDKSIRAFEVTTGAVAYDEPFGPITVAGLHDLGLVTNAEFAAYPSLSRTEKDAFLQAKLNLAITILPLVDYYNVTPVGLADSPFDAQLISGEYLATHTYGWTEFDIDAITGALTVTTYGIDAYSEDELLADPAAIAGRVPEIVSQFVVMPVPEPASWLLGATGVAALGIVSIRQLHRRVRARG